MTFHRIFNKSPMTSATSVAETVNLSGGKPQILVGIALLIFFSNNIYLFTCIVSCCDVRYVFRVQRHSSSSLYPFTFGGLEGLVGFNI